MAHKWTKFSFFASMIYLLFFRAWFRLGLEAFWHNRRMVKFLKQEVKAVCGHTLFSEQVWKRIRLNVMAAQLVHAFVARLHGESLSYADRKKAAFLGAVTPLVDDLTDHQRMTTAQILNYLTRPGPHEEEQRTLQHFYKQLFPGTAAFRGAFLSALQAQEDSLKQLEPNRLTGEELKVLSKNKGARAFVWFRHSFQSPLVEGEAEVCSTLGFVLQLLNDLFDVYKDTHAWQQTLLTPITDLRTFQHLFQNQVEQLKTQCQKLPLPTSAKARGWALLTPILGVSVVCLHQLLRLQGTSASFDARNFTRAQLVCDMAKWANRKAAVRESWLLMRAWNKK